MFIKLNKVKKIIFCYISINLLFIKINNINEEWEKCNLNPVLGNNKTGTLFDPFVLTHDNMCKMCVSWRPLKSIALSTSKDGINWSDLKITGQYKGIIKIGLSISENGNNFTKYEENPV